MINLFKKIYNWILERVFNLSNNRQRDELSSLATDSVRAFHDLCTDNGQIQVGGSEFVSCTSNLVFMPYVPITIREDFIPYELLDRSQGVNTEDIGILGELSEFLTGSSSMTEVFIKNNYKVNMCQITDVPRDIANEHWIIQDNVLSLESVNWLSTHSQKFMIVDALGSEQYREMGLVPIHLGVTHLPNLVTGNFVLATIHDSTVIYTHIKTDYKKSDIVYDSSIINKDTYKDKISEDIKPHISMCNLPFYMELKAPKNFIFRSNKSKSILLKYEELKDTEHVINIINKNYNSLRYNGV